MIGSRELAERCYPTLRGAAGFYYGEERREWWELEEREREVIIAYTAAVRDDVVQAVHDKLVARLKK